MTDIERKMKELLEMRAGRTAPPEAILAEGGELPISEPDVERKLSEALAKRAKPSPLIQQQPPINKDAIDRILNDLRRERADNVPDGVAAGSVKKVAAESAPQPLLDASVKAESPLEKKIAQAFDKSKVFIPEKADEPPQKISKESILNEIAKNLPADQPGQGEKAAELFRELDAGFDRAVQAAKFVAGGDLVYNVSQVSNGLLARLDVDNISPPYALLLQGFWSNLSSDIVSNYIKKKHFSPNVLKRIILLDLLTPNFSPAEVASVDVLLERPLEYAVAYMTLFMPSTLIMSSQDTQFRITKSSNVLQQENVQEGMKTILYEMIQDYRSRTLMRTVSTTGEVKQIMAIDEMLKYLSHRGIDIAHSKFVNGRVSQIYQELSGQIKVLINDTTNTNKNQKLEDVLAMANFYESVGNITRASACYMQLVKRQPGDELIIAEFGTFLNRNGFFEDELRLYDEFLRSSPNSPDVLSARSKVLLKVSQNKNYFIRAVNSVVAWKDKRNATKAYKDKAQTYLTLEKILETALYDTAIKADLAPMLDIVRSKGFLPDIIYDISIVLKNKNLKQDALSVLRFLSEREPKNQQALYLAGTLSFELGKHEDVVKYFSRLKIKIGDAENLLGQSNFHIKKFRASIRYFDNWLKKNPADVNALKLRAFAHLNMKNIDEAISDFRHVRTIAKDNGEIAFLLGELYYGKKSGHSYAKDYFQIAADAGFKKIESLIKLAQCWSKMKVYGSSLDAANAALGIDMNNTEALMLKCRALCELERDDELEVCCNSFLAQQPDNADINNMRSAAMERNMKRAAASGDFVTAEKKATDLMHSSSNPSEITQKVLISTLLEKGTKGDLEKLIATADGMLKSNPNSNFALYHKSVALRRLGNMPEARQMLDKLLRYYPNDTAAMKELAQILLAEQDNITAEEDRDYARALNVLMRFMHLKQNDPQVLRDISTIHYLRGSYEQALDYITRAEQYGKDSRIQSNKAFILFKMKRLDDAAKSAERAIQLGATTDLIFLLRGQIAKTANKLEEAISFYEYALKNAREPRDEITIPYAEVAIGLGRFQDAIASLDNLLNINSEIPRALALRGEANFGVGKRQEAFDDYKKSIELQDNVGVRQKIAQILYEDKNYSNVISILSDCALQTKDNKLLELLLNSYINSDRQGDQLAQSLASLVLSRPGPVDLKSLACEIEADASKDFSARISTYERAVKLSARPSVCMKLARAYVKVGKVDRAVDLCNKIISESGQNDFIDEATKFKNELVLEGRLAKLSTDADKNLRSRNYGVAIKLYDEVLAVKPNKDILAKKAEAEKADGRVSAAISTLCSIVSEWKDTDAALNAAGLSYGVCEYERALELYDFVLKSQPDNTGAVIGKSNVLFMLDDPNGALELLTNYSGKNRSDSIVWSGIGLAFFELGIKKEAAGEVDIGLLEKAVAAYDSALSVDARCGVAIINKGSVLMALKRFDEAIRCYTTASQLNLDNASTVTVNALIGLSEAFYEKGDYDIALQYINKAGGLEPQNRYVKTHKIKVFERLKRYSDAAVIYNEMGDGS